VRAHLPGVAPEASEECLTHSRAIVCYVAGRSCVRAPVLRLVPFRSRLAFRVQALEPSAREVDQDLARLHNTTLTHPLGKE
jgi:hypothetical protein